MCGKEKFDYIYIYISLYLSIYLCIYLSIYLSIYLLFVIACKSVSSVTQPTISKQPVTLPHLFLAAGCAHQPVHDCACTR